MRAFAKANVFLKLVGFDERKYHYLVSRFVLLDEIYDEIELTKDKTNAGFEIITKFSELECKNGDKFSEFGKFGCENAEFDKKMLFLRGLQDLFHYSTGKLLCLTCFNYKINL